MQTIPASRIRMMKTDDLERIADDPEAYTEETTQEAERELERRDYDISDPAGINSRLTNARAAFGQPSTASFADTPTPSCQTVATSPVTFSNHDHRTHTTAGRTRRPKFSNWTIQPARAVQ